MTKFSEAGIWFPVYVSHVQVFLKNNYLKFRTSLWMQI
jgi:hypothetical protein